MNALAQLQAMYRKVTPCQRIRYHFSSAITRPEASPSFLECLWFYNFFFLPLLEADGRANFGLYSPDSGPGCEME